MSVESNGDNLLLGRGKLYFDRHDADGNPTGLRYLGDCSQLELTPSVEKKERFGMSKAATTKLASVVMSQTHTLAIQMSEYQPENIALVLLGDSAALTDAGGAKAGEELTDDAKLDRIYQTAFRNISAVVVKVGVTTCDLGTDYEVVDAKLGLIHILAGAVKIADSDTVTVDYTAGAVATTKIAGGTTATIKGKLVFIGDPAQGPAYDVEFWNVQVNPSGALALITDDFGNLPLACEVLDDSTNHASDPLYRIVKR